MLPGNGVVVVFDLEYTAWEGSQGRGWSAPGEYREIIQIGAVRLDVAAGFRESAAFTRYVRPRLNPKLSQYIAALTGIDDDLLERAGVELAEAAEAFVAFCAPGLPVFANGGDGPTLMANLALRGLPCAMAQSRFHDISGLLAEAIEAPDAAVTTMHLPQLLDFEVTGRGHDALYDARCVAGALARLRARGKL